MRKILVGIMVIVVASSCADSSTGDGGYTDGTTPNRHSDFADVQTVVVEGYEGRSYECVVSRGGDGAGGLQCFPIREPNS